MVTAMGTGTAPGSDLPRKRGTPRLASAGRGVLLIYVALRAGHDQRALLELDDRLSFALREAAPDSVRLVHGQGVPAAQLQHRACLTDRLRPGFSARPGRPAFAIGVEEERAVHAAAGTLELPVPHVCVGAGEPASVRHDDRLPRRNSYETGYSIRCSETNARTAPMLVQGRSTY